MVPVLRVEGCVSNEKFCVLIFSALQGSFELNNWNIDDIQFSPLSFPEPSEFSLAAFGAFFSASIVGKTQVQCDWTKMRKARPRCSGYVRV